MALILIVEDDAAVGELIQMNLRLVGHSTFLAADGDAALCEAMRRKPDAALVDLMLPGRDGWELTRRFSQMDIPVIIVTARASLSDRVKGLELGADDYIIKPFEALELLARVSALLRRTQKVDEVYELDGVTVYLTAGYTVKDGATLPLTHKEFELLCVFVRNRNITLSRERLLAAVWGFDFLGETRTVDLHVQRLRKKLGWEGRIVAAYKQGYRLEAD